jgi:ectoine hydroxylase-related dioxygenase (phytanoyl-CoA dioxygenase family)
VVTAWLALSPASLESGCMRVMPGTHIGDVLPHEDKYDDANMLTRGQEITEGVDDDHAVHMPLEIGQMSFHNYRLAHASGANNATDRRIGVSMHFMPTDTQQIVGEWDSAALVRGEDTFGNFAPTPIPEMDFDPVAMAFHVRAQKAQSDVLYTGAAVNTKKL